MCIKRVVGFVSILVAIMVGVGSNFGNIIDIPSILIVFGCTIGALLFSGRSITDAFNPLFSRNILCSNDGESLWHASETWHEAEKYFVGSGFVGFLIGCIIMLANIEDPAAIGPGMAIGILESRNCRQFDNECLRPEGQRQPVNPYATEDVLVEAEKLYQFVQKK